MNLLLTGATGTFGRAWIRRMRTTHPAMRLVGYSRDEVKQDALKREFDDWPHLFLGDVRDTERLDVAMRGIDTVVHAAALKRVDAGSYNPDEIDKTNVRGTINVVDAAIRNGVKRVVVISSDKAVNPTNIYGASKYMAECCAIAGNSSGYPRGTRIAAVRYGNILGSRGSVVGIWRDQIARGLPMALTSTQMTRFIMTIEQAVDLVGFALDYMDGGEVFVPILPRAYVADLARAVGPDDWPLQDVGVRPGGEKFGESLLNEEEPSRTYAYQGYYLIAPSLSPWRKNPTWPGEPVDPRMLYRSDVATRESPFLTVEALRALIAGTEACR